MKITGEMTKAFLAGGLVLLFVFTLVGHADAQTCVEPPQGLIGWWPGDGNADDIADSNNGALMGGMTFAPGMVGQAFSLDGIDDYVDDGVSSVFNLDSMTLDAWVHINPSTNTSDRRVISKDNVLSGGTRKEFALKTSSRSWTGVDGTPQFEVLIGGGFERVSAPTALTAGWHHLAGVRDTTAARFELWVDGQLVASKDPTVFGPIDSAAHTVIGQVGPSFNGEYFNGLIDEAEIFDRPLSAKEIKAIFEAGSAGKCKLTTVIIDISPGSFPNSINPRNEGVIPVAILTTDTFDATTVDPTTVRFGKTGTEAAPVHFAFEDVDEDGDTDMILKFRTQDTGIVCGATAASLTGATFGGQMIEGSDSIRTVGCK